MSRAVLFEAQATTQAPLALVGNVLLATMSLAAQDIVKIRRFDGLISSCTLYMLGILESGERKSTVETLIAKPVRAFDADGETTYNSALKVYGAEKRVWESEHRALLRRFDKALSGGDACDLLKEQIVELSRSEPRPPRRDRLVYNDVTPAAFLYGLHTNSPSAGIIDDEAGRIFSGSLVNDLGLLTKAWDGSDLQVDRRSTGSFSVRSPRVTISWLVQGAIFATYMERKGDEARGIGFLARCLIAQPATTQGTRFIRSEPVTPERLPEFHQRIADLLNKRSTTEDIGVDHRVQLHFSPEAQTEWIHVFNEIESHINPGGAFCQHRDYASKVAENIARVAAIFHCVEGYDGAAISLETLRSATTVVLWYAQEFVRLFSPPDPLAETVKDAQELDAWLLALVRSRRWMAVQRNFILQRGPNKLRSKERLEWALGCLQEAGKVQVYRQGRTWWVSLNPAWFGSAAQNGVPVPFLPIQPLGGISSGGIPLLDNRV